MVDFNSLLGGECGEDDASAHGWRAERGYRYGRALHSWGRVAETALRWVALGMRIAYGDRAHREW